MRNLLLCSLLAMALPAQEPLLRGVCFGPFRDGEAPGGRSPLLSTLREDIAVAHRVAARLRTYGMGGTGVLVPELCAEAGVVCWPGAWISGDRAADDLECELLLHSAMRFPKAVETVLVGNEVLLRGDLDEASLWRRVSMVRMALRKADFETPVGTAEPWQVWLAHPDFANGILDVVVVHVHAYWDGVEVADAARYTIEKLDAVRAIVDSDSTRVVLGEFGWPTAGEVKGAAVPSPANAARYLRELLPLLDERDEPYFAFELWDEAWKSGAEGSVGPHWGLCSSEGTPKPELVEVIPRLERAASTRPPRRTDADLRVPGKGDERLPAVVAVLMPYVERATGLAFLAPPQARVPDDFEWGGIVRAHKPDAKDPDLEVAITSGLYLSEAQEIVFSPFVGSYLATGEAPTSRGWSPASVDRRARDAWLTVAHELTHVLQDQHFALIARMRATDDRAQQTLLRSIAEGHAELIEDQLALELFGLDGRADASIARSGARDPLRTQGFLFMRQLRATAGEDAVRAALGDKPPTPKEFSKGVFDA